MDTVILVFVVLAFIEAQIALLLSAYIFMKNKPPAIVEIKEEEEFEQPARIPDTYHDLRAKIEELS